MKTRIVTFFLCLCCMASVAIAQTDSLYAVASEPSIAEQVQGTDTNSSGMVANILHWYDAHMNYYAVGALMTVESSFIPFPSEVVIPPAVYVASNPESASGMKIWIIVLFGTIGAMLGAFINYYLSRWLGRPIIYKFVDSKFGHMLLLSGEKMEKAENYFNKHGNISTLIGRMVPVVRQLISIPAGLAKMNVGAFALYTFIGAFIWNCILAALGWLAYRAADPTVIKRYSHILSILLIALLGIAVVWFVAKALLKRKK